MSGVKLIFYTLLFGLFSCAGNPREGLQIKNKSAQDSLVNMTIIQEDSVISFVQGSTEPSIQVPLNKNSIKGISKERLRFLIDSIPMLKVPIGNKEAFFHDFPQTIESEYGGGSDGMKGYIRDSLATVRSWKAFSSFRDQIQNVSDKMDVKDLELFLDSSYVNLAEGMRLKFIGILDKSLSHTTFLYKPINNYDQYEYRLISINSDAEIIDIKGVNEFLNVLSFESIYTNELNYIDTARVLHVKRFVVYAKTESTSDYIGYVSYKLNNQGFFVRYFSESEGYYDEDYKSSSSTSNLYLESEKGHIKKHRKSGKWEEISMRHDYYPKQNVRLNQPLYIKSNYKNGVKNGLWKYYNLINDTIRYENGHIRTIPTNQPSNELVMLEEYLDGRLISRKRKSTQIKKPIVK